MQRALIISDNPNMAHTLGDEFSSAGWSSQRIEVAALLERSMPSIADHQCLVLAIDTDFYRRFGNLIAEMGSLFREHSRHTPLYLMFEHDYDPHFSSWLEHTKRLFKSTVKQQNAREAIQEITLREAAGVPQANFVSPMDAF